jgi:hypothetical protein
MRRRANDGIAKRFIVSDLTDLAGLKASYWVPGNLDRLTFVRENQEQSASAYQSWSSLHVSAEQDKLVQALSLSEGPDPVVNAAGSATFFQHSFN